MRVLAAFAVTAILLSCFAVSAKGQVSGRAATEHFLIDHNRIFVELEFVRPDGKLRKVLAFVDSADPSFEFPAALVRELGLEKNIPIRVRFGGMDLKVSPKIDVSGYEGSLSAFSGMMVEANLPSTVLDQYDVLLDYGKRTLTLAAPGTLLHRGVRIPCTVNRKTGLVVVRARVAGSKHAFSVDNGAAYTWVDRPIAKAWTSSHPGWLRGIGAVGDANMNGMLPELTGIIMRLPEIDLDGLHLNSIGALGVGPGWDATMPSFFKWYSEKTPVPVSGFLGGNVLKNFRLEIDYANSATYWSRESADAPHDLDQVGIMIRPGLGGKYFVAALPTQNGKPTVNGIAVNDRLISVDGFAVTGATMGKVLEALHGRPGEIRALVFERGGKQFIAKAPVTRF